MDIENADSAAAISELEAATRLIPTSEKFHGERKAAMYALARASATLGRCG
jgi:hypothetical protein